MSDQTAAESTLPPGPLFREAAGGQPYLEVYGTDLRRGALRFGYRNATIMLLEAAITRTQSVSATILHPILFLLRHHIELTLKSLLSDYSESGGKENHNIKQLWSDVAPLARKFYDEADVKQVGAWMTELDDVDHAGVSFRYAMTKANSKQEALPINFPFEAVDLLYLRERLEALDTFFFGLDAMLDEAHRIS